MRTLWVGLAAVVSLAIAVGSARAEKVGEAPRRIEVPKPPPPIDLAPLPEPPPIAAAPEALPGSDGALAVVAARPTGATAGNFRPTITFSKPMVALGTVERERGLAAPAKIEPPLPGEWRWLGSTSVEYVTTGLIPYSTRFTVTVPAGLRALDGAALKEPYAFSFETPRPEVQQVAPASGWRWVRPAQRFTLLFNQPVVDLARHLRLEVAGEPWPLDVVEAVSVAEERRAHEEPRRHARPDFEARGVKNRQTRYRVAPARPMPLDREVRLSVLGALHGADGPLTIEPRSWSFRTYGPMRLDGFGCPRGDRCPYGPLVIASTNEVDLAALRARLALEPAVEIDWERARAERGSPWSPPRAFLPGKYRPGTRYEVRAAAGVKDVFGQEARGAGGSFATTDLEPGFDVGGRTALLEASGDGAIALESVNLTWLVARVWRLDPADVARHGEEHEWQRSTPAGKPAEVTLDASGARNAARTQPLPVRSLMGGARSGLFFAEVIAPELDEKHYRRAQRVLGQLTDLAVHAKLGATSGVVWVTRLSDGKPVPGAELALYDRAGEVRWRGRSDADGLAVVPGLAALGLTAARSWQVPFALASATKDGDTGVTLSTWSGGLGPESLGLPTDWDGEAPKSLGAVFAERGIYRPGETVHLKSVVRFRRMGEIATPDAGSKLKLRTTPGARRCASATRSSRWSAGRSASRCCSRPTARRRGRATRCAWTCR
jgi:hypothetical protein